MGTNPSPQSALAFAVAVAFASRYPKASALGLTNSRDAAYRSAEGWSEAVAEATDLLPLPLPFAFRL
jgi:hypothetical protein